MKRKILSILLITALAFGAWFVFNAPPTSAASAQAGETIVFITGYGIGTKNLTDITSWLTGLGHTVRVGTKLNASILAGADALIFGGVYGPVAGLAELNASNLPVLLNTLTSWFNGVYAGELGGKFIWVGGDSDYGGREWINKNSSKILETLGSALRVDLCAMEDPVSKCGTEAYRVVANETEAVDPDGVQITTGVTKGALFHGPAPVYAVNPTGLPVNLANTTVTDVFRILSTTINGTVVENNPLISALAHTNGAKGKWVMMAGENNLGTWGNSRAIVTGASPYGDYEPIYRDSYYGRAMNGSLLVKQAILWGLEATPIYAGPSTPTLTAPSTDNDGAFDVSWTTSTDPDGVVDHYQLQMSSTSGFSIISNEWNQSTITKSISGLDTGSYYFRVRAVDDDGYTSEWSTARNVGVTIPTPTTDGFSPPIQAAIIVGAILLFMLPVAYLLFTEKKR